MLTFLLNRLNTYQDHAPREIAQCGLPFIGVSAEVPDFMRRQMAQSAPVTLFDSCRTLGDDLTDSIAAAADLGAKQLLVSIGNFCDAGKDERAAIDPLLSPREACSRAGLELLITNRRPFNPDIPVSAGKLLRLCQSASVRIAFDVGASHASLRALEDFYDLSPSIAAVLLNDNLGREALCPVGHEDYIPGSIPDDMRQPGYGSAPTVALAEAARHLLPNIPFYINGQKHAHATLPVVLRETRCLLAGKVFINPAGGSIGKGADGRVLV